MRKTFVILFVAVLIGAIPAYAELQNVDIGGSIRIRGNWYDPEASVDSARARNPLVDPLWTLSGAGTPNVRWTALQLAARPIGALAAPAGALLSGWSWDDNGHSTAFVEERTRLKFTADFTDEVTAVIELDSYDIWGEDFRSNYITGADMRAASVNDVEVYQAYIEGREMWGLPLCLRIGRQEISLGNEWLVGVNDTSSMFTGLSFDGILAVYEFDLVTVAGVWAKLAETSPTEEDGDVDLYGIYATYNGLEDITIDGYWMLVRDARMNEDITRGWVGEWLEDVFDVDDHDVTKCHTIGLRGAGTVGAIDFEAEAAYQFGEADMVGATFAPILYSDDDADFDEWGMNLEVGYTFDTAWEPRAYLGLVYLGGEDERDIGNIWEWFRQFLPFYRPDASVSFNRLFSNVEYSEFLDNTSLSNVWIGRAGVSACPTENVELLLSISYFEAVEEFDAPWHFYWLNGNRVAPFAFLSIFTEENDDELGWEVGLYATYNYSEDLTFKAGWAHLFVDDGLEEGNFVPGNGLLFNGGTDDDDADYLFVETKICF
ncbi:MAG TPA: alginate export family protein [Candidatus Hydrogenedentes bacterium]|nr:alginate export family protein [Candidatus Hydrogenedentota bacterium]HIJ72987.1 alginate export family protein [Candidatus Hydrogenedentota bacterium]